MFDVIEPVPDRICQGCGGPLTRPHQIKACSYACANKAAAWPQERVKTLRRLVGDGLTYEIIGARMGLTRNAVIGKTRRLGLSNGQPRNRPRPGGSAGTPRARPAVSRQAQRHPSDAINARLRKQPSLPLVEPPKGTKTLMELGPYGRECRYIYGSGPFLYCGQPTAIDGTAWCPYHKAIVFPPRAAVPLKGFIAWRR